MNSYLRLGAVCAFLVLVSVSVAEAQHGGPFLPKAGHCHRGPYGYGTTSGWGWFGYYFPRVDWQYEYDYYRVPYYAMHPPVYYSHPVPRTYGYSPYAYPPGTLTPEIVEAEPKTIQNKFVPKKKTSEKAPPNRVTVGPVRLKNPYVFPAETASSARQSMTPWSIRSASDTAGGPVTKHARRAGPNPAQSPRRSSGEPA